MGGGLKVHGTLTLPYINLDLTFAVSVWCRYCVCVCMDLWDMYFAISSFLLS